MVMTWRAQIHSKKPPKLAGHPLEIPRGMGKRGREDRVQNLYWNRDVEGDYGGGYHNQLLQ